jgi:hypothetical protein
MSVCPSACNNSAPTGRIFVKFDIRFFLICHQKCKYILNSGKFYGIFYVFFWVIPRRLNFVYNDVSEHSVCSIFIGLSTFERGTVCSETSLAYKIQTPVELPRRKHTTFSRFMVLYINNDIHNISFSSF